MGIRTPTESTGSPSATARAGAAESGSQPQANPIADAGGLSGDRAQTPVAAHSSAGWLRSLETPAERLARWQANGRYWAAIHKEAKRRNEAGFYGPYGR